MREYTLGKDLINADTAVRGLMLAATTRTMKEGIFKSGKLK